MKHTLPSLLGLALAVGLAGFPHHNTARTDRVVVAQQVPAKEGEAPPDNPEVEQADDDADTKVPAVAPPGEVQQPQVDGPPAVVQPPVEP